MDIFIKGEIDKKMVEDIANHILTEYKLGEIVYITIDSNGGFVDCGFQIADMIKEMKANGSTIVTINSNNVMSIATIIYLEGGIRYWDKDKGDFLIHLPYVEDYTGNADDFLKAGAELLVSEAEIARRYADMTDVFSEEYFLEKMKEEKPLTIEELIKFGFVTELI